MTGIPEIAALITAGRLPEAQHGVNALLEREPAHAQAWYLKGVICSRMNDNGTAIGCFNQALQYQPDFREAALNLGRTLERVGQAVLAIKVFEHLLTIEQFSGEKRTPAKVRAADAKKIETWFRQGESLQQQGNAQGAADCFRQVLTLQPDMPEALVNLGLALHGLRRYADAEAALLQALRAYPDHPQALNILAATYAQAGEPLRAIAVWRRAVAAHPMHYEALVNLAKAFSSLELYAEAVTAYEQALQQQLQHPEMLMELVHMNARLCRWEAQGAAMARMHVALKASPRWMEQFLVSVHWPQYQLENAKRYVAHFYPAAAAYDVRRVLPADSRGDKKLRIGYLSSDFHAHATAYLISELFELHDKSRFEIVAYSYGKAAAGTERSRIQQAVSQFRDIRQMDDIAAASLIRHDGIDILVDLKGYTTGGRMSLLSSRPAPIQVHYLGHPGTTGAPFIDYFIADPVVAPVGADADFSEALVRLPHCYQINDRKRPLPFDVPSRAQYGLPAQGFVFGAFNNAYKITPEMFDVWMRLLSMVPGSVLWLYETHAEATANMRKAVQNHGIDPARLVVAASVPLTVHLSRYRHVDLFLDTAPVCGHTTASDALWCAVPVVTMAGNTFISRVATSLLHAVGLPQLAVSDIAAYEALALELAHDPGKLHALKQHLDEGRLRFPLFNSEATTRALEDAYGQMVRQHRSGRAPQAFTID